MGQTKDWGDQWKWSYERILKHRADRLGVSLEEAARIENERPLFLAAAEERARRQGTSAEEVMAHYSKQLLDSEYPTADCLTPDEVLEYNHAGTLAKERLAHLDNCHGCVALLAASSPSDQGMLFFVEQLRMTLSQARSGHSDTLSSSSPSGGVNLSHQDVSNARLPILEEVSSLSSHSRNRSFSWRPAFAGACAGAIVSAVAALLGAQLWFATGTPFQTTKASLQLQEVDAKVTNVSNDLKTAALEVKQSQEAMSKELAKLRADIDKTTVRKVVLDSENSPPDLAELRRTLLANQEILKKRLDALQVSLDETTGLAFGAGVGQYLAQLPKSYKFKKGEIISTGIPIQLGSQEAELRWKVTNPEQVSDVADKWKKLYIKHGLEPSVTETKK